ncbi:hypothetical protein WDU94_007244 [Cyamophila willieti]
MHTKLGVKKKVVRYKMKKVLKKTKEFNEMKRDGVQEDTLSKTSDSLTRPPFSVDIDENASTENCSIKLFPHLTSNTKDIEFTLKITKNPQTGKPQYEIIYFNNKDNAEFQGDGHTSQENELFKAFDLESGKTVTMVIEGIDSPTPFIIDTANKEKKSLDPPRFVHYAPSNRKRYAVDLKKFQKGILMFKDPETEEEIVIDLTKRYDPLTGRSLKTGLDNEIYLGQFKNGEVYILKDGTTQDIQVVRFDGRLALNYFSNYDSATRTTKIVNSRGHLLTILEGELRIKRRESQVGGKKVERNEEKGNGDDLLISFGHSKTPNNKNAIGLKTYQEYLPGKQVRFENNLGPTPAILDQEKYFENLNLEESSIILDEVKQLPSLTRHQVLGYLIHVIEFEKDFINFALSAKIQEERSYIQKYLICKEMRQNKFIFGLLNSNNANMDHNDFKQKVNTEMNKENEFIMDKLNGKISEENNLLIESLKKEMHDSRKVLVSKSSKKCYQSLKRIIYRYLSEKLELEVKLMRQEVEVNLSLFRIIAWSSNISPAAAKILATKSLGGGSIAVLYTRDLISPQKKKSSGLKSGHLAMPPRPIHLPGNMRLRVVAAAGKIAEDQAMIRKI